MKTITIAIKEENGREGSQKVKAYATACPHLFVHRSVTQNGTDDTWTITHSPTGWSVLQGLKHRKVALMACNKYFSNIEGWEKLRPDNCAEFFKENYNVLRNGRDCALEIAP